jgi:hypothetical protein
MRSLFDQLVTNRTFGLIIAPIIAVGLSIYLVIGWIRTNRAVKRGDPLKVWYLKEPIYPENPFYATFAFQRQAPAIMVLVVWGLIALLFLIPIIHVIL